MVTPPSKKETNSTKNFVYFKKKFGTCEMLISFIENN